MREGEPQMHLRGMEIELTRLWLGLDEGHERVGEVKEDSQIFGG